MRTTKGSSKQLSGINCEYFITQKNIIFIRCLKANTYIIQLFSNHIFHYYLFSIFQTTHPR